MRVNKTPLKRINKLSQLKQGEFYTENSKAIVCFDLKNRNSQLEFNV